MKKLIRKLSNKYRILNKEQAMAKEEKTTIGLSKSTIATIALALTVLAAMAFWKDRGSVEATIAASISQSIQSNTYRNDIQDNRLTACEIEDKSLRKDLTDEKLAAARLIGKVDATADNVKEIRISQQELTLYLMQYDFGTKKETEKWQRNEQ